MENLYTRRVLKPIFDHLLARRGQAILTVKKSPEGERQFVDCIDQLVTLDGAVISGVLQTYLFEIYGGGVQKSKNRLGRYLNESDFSRVGIQTMRLGTALHVAFDLGDEQPGFPPKSLPRGNFIEKKVFYADETALGSYICHHFTKIRRENGKVLFMPRFNIEGFL